MKVPSTLESNNPAVFPSVFASQVGGHKTRATLEELYDIPDAILSLSKVNDKDDAIGQKWYVASEKKDYQLVSWELRHQAEGWKEYKSGVTSWNELGDKPTIPTKTSELDNDAQFVPKRVVDELVEIIGQLRKELDELNAIVNPQKPPVAPHKAVLLRDGGVIKLRNGGFLRIHSEDDPNPPIGQVSDALMLKNGDFVKLKNGNYVKVKP